MLADSKICKYIIPNSDSDSDYEQYEYFLVWISPDGGVYCWLFEDFERTIDIEGTVINTKSDNITKLFESANQSVRLIAEDITEDELDAISDIIRSLEIRRYYKDFTYDELAIITSQVIKAKSQKRYNFVIEVAEKEKGLMR